MLHFSPRTDFFRGSPRQERDTELGAFPKGWARVDGLPYGKAEFRTEVGSPLTETDGKHGVMAFVTTATNSVVSRDTTDSSGSHDRQSFAQSDGEFD